MPFELIEYVCSGRGLRAASEATWDPHWLSNSKGLCLSSLPKETASAHYLQTASVTFLCQWLLIVLKEHCTNVQTAVCWERTAIISIFHLKAAITANKAWATWLCWIWGTFTEAFTLSERRDTRREGTDRSSALDVLLNTTLCSAETGSAGGQSRLKISAVSSWGPAERASADCRAWDPCVVCPWAGKVGPEEPWGPFQSRMTLWLSSGCVYSLLEQNLSHSAVPVKT